MVSFFILFDVVVFGIPKVVVPIYPLVYKRSLSEVFLLEKPGCDLF